VKFLAYSIVQVVV